MEVWHDFFVAEAGASAALVGLLFVSVSINLARILAIPRLPNRALVALALLVVILLQSTLMLVPGQPDYLLGIEVLVLGVGGWVLVTRFDLAMYRLTDAQYRSQTSYTMGLTQLAIVPYIIAGVVMITVGLAGLYFLAVGVVFSFLKSIFDAWVLLVEINR